MHNDRQSSGEISKSVIRAVRQVSLFSHPHIHPVLSSGLLLPLLSKHVSKLVALYVLGSLSAILQNNSKSKNQRCY